MTKTIEELLTETLHRSINIIELAVVNDSKRHRNHLPMKNNPHTDNSHFIVKIVSDDFIGMGRVERQKKIYHLLTELWAGELHALNLSCLTGEEQKKLTKGK